MELLIPIAAAVLAVWLTWFALRGSLIAACLVYLLVASCFGYPFLHFDLGPTVVTLDRFVIVAVLVAYLVQRERMRRQPFRILLRIIPHHPVDDAPVLDAPQSGRKLAALAKGYDFSLFEYWASDYAGHKQQMDTAIELMETFDGVLGGLIEEMDEDMLVLVTSDHGNMEDLSTRRHTDANVPALVIGEKAVREEFTRDMKSLTDIAPAIWRIVNES